MRCADEPDALAVVLIDHRAARVAEALVALQKVSHGVESELIGDDSMPPLHERAGEFRALALTFLAVEEAGEKLIVSSGPRGSASAGGAP